VADDGLGFGQGTSGTGIGLKNLRERLRLTCGEQAGVVIGDGAVREYIATMPAFLDANGKFNENNYRLALAGGNPPRT
ncbi:hypothetical protein ACS229_31095, partial [Klebsiella pneumoniae]|uniref:hypothetical protein n=1 Tax=Klebsiella pneumoniae TaxID=573 RepID=UPI003F27DC14